MKQIKLQSLSLVNFKGIRKLELDFSENTTICGDNGTGKTTVFDAFTWLLFGKDSQNQSDQKFNIKTLGEDGKPILKLEHSVTGVLSVDGRTVKLQRSYVEKWVKPSGTTVETLQNHQTVFYVNDAKCGTKKEYDAEVSAILDEGLFRMVTNPFYFVSLSAQEQKAMLMEMAGNVTDEEVAALNPDYQTLLDEINGSSLEKYAKEVSAKKSACKKELEIIPSQIETAQRLMPESEDWQALEASIEDKKALISAYDSQIADKSNRDAAENRRKEGIQKQVGEKKLAIAERESEIKQTLLADRSNAQMEVSRLESAFNLAKAGKENSDKAVEYAESDVKSLEERLSDLREKSVEKQRMELEVSAEKLVYPDGAFVCPTCKRPLESEDIEAKQNELRANFNKDKAQRVRAIQQEIATIKQEGRNTKAKLEKAQRDLDGAKMALASNEEKMSDAETAWKTALDAMPDAPDVASEIAKDSIIINFRNELAELENQLTMNQTPADTSEIQRQKGAANEELQGLIQRLAKRDALQNAQKEIASLEKKRVSTNQKLADLEKMEYLAFSFQKDKDEKLMERINGLFQRVSFSFVSTQLNGGEKITCVCTVDGVPYPDVNTAKKINAGIDIINALCRHYAVTAPIFLDNRESVNAILPTDSQVINLCVSNDKQLAVK